MRLLRRCTARNDGKRNKRAGPKGPALFILVAGAGLLENGQLYAEPFPLVA
jgi:hypothetical protein